MFRTLILFEASMVKTGSYTLDTKVLDALIKNCDGDVNEAVMKAAFMVEGRAKAKAPVDTGALRASIYVSMKKGGKGNEAMVAAKARRPEAVVEALPTPKENAVAYVGPSVEYGQEVEMGSSTRSGTPYLQPALRETEADLKKLLSAAVKP